VLGVVVEGEGEEEEVEEVEVEETLTIEVNISSSSSYEWRDVISMIPALKPKQKMCTLVHQEHDKSDDELLFVQVKINIS